MNPQWHSFIIHGDYLLGYEVRDVSIEQHEFAGFDLLTGEPPSSWQLELPSPQRWTRLSGVTRL